MASFLLLLIYILFHYSRPADFIPLLELFPYMKILAGLLFISIFVEKGRMNFFTRLPQNRLLGVIIVLMFLSIPFAFHRSKCLFGALEFCKVTMICIAFLNLVDSVKAIRLVMWTIIISTIYILYEAVNLYLSGGLEARYAFSATQKWDANELAAFLVTAMPLVIGLLRLSKDLIVKVVLAGGVAAYLIGIVATQSRGGFIGVLAISGCYVLSAKRKVLSLLLIVIVAAAGIAVMPNSPLDRLTSISISKRETGDSTDERLQLWKSGLKMSKDHPLFGVGVTCYSKAIGEVYVLSHHSGKWLTAHNSFILILAEVGIPAFLCYLAIYYLNLRDIRIINRRLKKENINPETKRTLSILSNSFKISFAGFAATAFFLSRTYELDMFIIMAFIIALKQITERLEYDKRPNLRREKAPSAATAAFK